MSTIHLPKIDVEPRQQIGTRYAARARKAGRLPAVIYGHHQAPLHVTADYKALTTLLHGHAHVVEVLVAGKSEPCLIKDVQWNHLGNEILHVDLERVDLTERVTTEVDLLLAGDAKGLKQAGAILEHPLSQIEIECLAINIPQSIKVDVSNLEVGGQILVKDIKLPEGITTTLSPETVIASISIIKEEVAAPAAEGASATEPEVIKRKPAEGDDAAADAKPAGKK